MLSSGMGLGWLPKRPSPRSMPVPSLLKSANSWTPPQSWAGERMACHMNLKACRQWHKLPAASLVLPGSHEHKDSSGSHQQPHLPMQMHHPEQVRMYVCMFAKKLWTYDLNFATFLVKITFHILLNVLVIIIHVISCYKLVIK